MKLQLYYICLLCVSVALSDAAFAQQTGQASLDINKVKASINSDGALFWDYLGSARFEVPAGSGAHTIFADGLWIGGYDENGQLHIAAQTYRQSGADFFSGPFSDSAAYTSAYENQWATVWKINKTAIDSFASWYANPSLYPAYQIPQSILTWPGNGDTTIGQAEQLAPYVDANSDGIYNPQNGDYPCIKGDQFVYFMYTDDRSLHGETGGKALKVEIHVTAYAFNRPGNWQDSAIYVNYRIINRSDNTYRKTFIGKWTDFDIGSHLDDYVGCDVEHSMFYGYNGTLIDGGGPIPSTNAYGANPPAQGVVFLRGPEADLNDGVDNNLDGTIDEAGEYCRMNAFVAYENDFTITGNPKGDSIYYRYMDANWIDGTHVTYSDSGYGGTLSAQYMYPGSSDPLGYGTGMQPQAAWDESTAGNTPGDRRGLGGTGPFTFEAGEELCLDFVYLFGRGTNGPQSSVQRLQAITDSALAQYNPTTACACQSVPLSIAENNAIQIISIYPNPADGVIFIMNTITSPRAQFEILDITGKVASQGIMATGNFTAIDIQRLPQGVYMLRISDGGTVAVGRFVKE
jgi:hypothetical protein